jgi:hypothetical protein
MAVRSGYWKNKPEELSKHEMEGNFLDERLCPPPSPCSLEKVEKGGKPILPYEISRSYFY